MLAPRLLVESFRPGRDHSGAAQIAFETERIFAGDHRQASHVVARHPFDGFDQELVGEGHDRRVAPRFEDGLLAGRVQVQALKKITPSDDSRQLPL